ncbi:MAG: hypothetical protein Q7S62_03080 [bacterium]|nr:hypothetical protein [bacterium]
MKKLLIEITLSAVIVFGLTFIAYNFLAGISPFWNTQFIWSVVLAVGWAIVAAGYYHQGWLVYTQKSSANVSIVLPIAVFFIQCVLFVKGIYYQDWSLVWGAVIVNSGVVFSLYQIMRQKTKQN